MKTIEKEYKKEYGEISIDETQRLLDFLDTHKLSKSQNSIFDEIDRINHIKWKKEKIIIYLLPKATPRPRSTSNGSFFYVKGAKDNREIFEKSFKEWNMDLIITPCKFRCVSYFPIPKSMKTIDQILAEFGFIRPISKPDFDNVAKTYSDMIQGSLLLDDALIVEGISEKFYSWKPRIEITIKYMELFDCDFNKKKVSKKNKLFNK